MNLKDAKTYGDLYEYWQDGELNHYNCKQDFFDMLDFAKSLTNDTCPICGRNRDQDISSEKMTLRALGLVSEIVDVGGRLLKFENGAELRLSDQCNNCDREKIHSFLSRISK